MDYPRLVRSEGVGPSQYGTKGLVDSRLAEMEEKYDLRSDELADGFGEEGEESDAQESESDETTADDSNDIF